MTTTEFQNLKAGDHVMLKNSNTNDIFTVNSINLNEGEVDYELTSTNGYTMQDSQFYQNLVIVNDVAIATMESAAKMKETILSMFDDFHYKDNYRCTSCPFKVECKNVYDFTRMHSTSTLTICEALNLKEIPNYM